jgi:2-polyprenyl-3-methyl-5-hydroxy-6-metoxy-1,4-benzoquinol methylase
MEISKNYMKRFESTRIFVGERDRFLTEKSKNKHIVHIGCTDWPDQVSQMQKGNFLHSKLVKVTKNVVGVDIDVQGIANLEVSYPQEKFITGDIGTDTDVQDKIIQLAPDIIVIPDVIEHVENAREFLSGLKYCLDSINGRRASQTIAIITTPNAYALKTFLPSLVGLDFTHPDHCLLHNEVTIRHALNDSDLKVHSIAYSRRSIRARYGFFASVITIPIDFIGKFIPRFSDTLIVTVS